MSNYRLYTALTWLWFLLISVLTVLKIAPDNLNADILINSVMSLQKLTLYYWGQNRILNVLPLTVAWIKNPALNLAAVLVVTSMCFYGLLYLISRFASFMTRTENEKETTLTVFIIISSVFLFVFNAHFISEITIWHIEYSLPALLLIFSFFKLLCRKKSTNDWREFIAPVIAIILAIGINPSIVIPAVLTPMATAIYRKSINLTEALLIIVSGFAFLIWHLVASAYNDASLYNGFSLDILYSGLPKVIDGFLHSVNLLMLLVLFVIILIGKVVLFGLKDEQKYGFHENPVFLYATHMAILFSIGWLFLFSGNRWVETNQFSVRYFIYIFFALIFIFALHTSLILKCFSAKKQTILAGLLAIVATSSIVSTITASAASFDNFIRNLGAISIQEIIGLFGHPS